MSNLQLSLFPTVVPQVLELPEYTDTNSVNGPERAE